MSFNLIAERPRIEDWADLCARLRPLAGEVELFPIPSCEDGDTDALGICVPRSAANEKGWDALERLLRHLLTVDGMSVTELISGSRVTMTTLPKVRNRLMGR